MVRPGKERAAPAAADDEVATQVTPQEGRWRAGVNRQSQTSAEQHQCAAGLASGTKRKLIALSPEERAAKRNADQQHRRRVQGEQKAAVALEAAAARKVSEFHAAFELVAKDAALGDCEQLDFCEWLQQQELKPEEASLAEWRDSDSYERTKRDRIIEGCTCFLQPDGKRVNSLPYDELKRRIDDGVLQSGNSFDAWDARGNECASGACVGRGTTTSLHQAAEILQNRAHMPKNENAGFIQHTV